MEKKIYLVVEYVGLYRNNKVLKCAFTDKTKAWDYVSELDRKYHSECVFEEKLWSKIEEEMIDLLDSMDEEFCTNPYEGGTKDWELWNEGFEVFEKIKYLELLHKHGFTDATIGDVEKQIEYNFYKDKEVTVTVEELTLFE